MHRRIALVMLMAACAASAAQVQNAPAAAAAASTATAAAGVDGAQTRALQRASDAVVGVRVRAVDDARSAATLGRQREGSGVVIGDDGLVLTIGYLILEADQVQLTTDDGRVVPARTVAYDLASGFGLVRALVPLKIEAVPIGAAAALAPQELLMVATGGRGGAVGGTRLVAQRGFSGYWEYHIDGALFTSPPRPDHSGAGLFNRRGELVGIGSLLVADAAGGAGEAGTRTPGNMFVPTDLLAPILAELLANGSSRQSARAWLGLNCAEAGGEIRVVRVNDDSPAEAAGLRVGDRIERIDGVAVTRLEALWKTLWRGDGAERAVRLDIRRDGVARSVTVQAVDRAQALRRPAGV